MQTTFLMLASVFGFIGVGLGAFGAHALNAVLTANDRLATFQTGVQYHLIHAVVLLGVALLAGQQQSLYLNIAGWAFTLGIVLFSGSLYVLSLANIRIMGAVAPLGGLAFLVGWGCLFAHAWTTRG